MDNPGYTLNPTHPRHMIAAGIAVVISVVLHILLIELFPPFQLGNPDHAAGPERGKSIRMQREKQNLPEELRQFDEVLNQEFALVETANDLAVFPAAVDQQVLDEPVISSIDPAGSGVTLANPDLPSVVDDVYIPRREILAMQDSLFESEIVAIPRQYIPDLERQIAVPDIVMPVQLEPGITVPPPATLLSADTSLTALLPGSRSEVTEAALDEVMKQDLNAFDPYEPRIEASQLVAETLEEVTEIEAVEQLLTLQVNVAQPPDDPYAYFKINIQRAGANALPVLPRDVLLIQDCSESMTQSKLNQCKKGLHRWIDHLGSEDRLNVVGFREAPYRCFEDWTSLQAASRARARWFIEDMRSMGRTDVFASLKEILDTPSDPERPVIAVMVSDGRPTTGLVDSSDIIEQFTQQNDGRFSVFSVGGGKKVNRFLLDLISYRNRGDSLVVERNDDIPDAIDKWAVELSRPVLSDLRYHFSGVDEQDIYPRSLTHLYLDRPLVIYGRCPKLAPQTAFQIVGRSGDQLHDMVFALDWENARKSDDSLPVEWAWRRIYNLIGEHIKTRNPQILEEIYATADQYGLKVPYGDRLYLR